MAALCDVQDNALPKRPGLPLLFAFASGATVYPQSQQELADGSNYDDQRAVHNFLRLYGMVLPILPKESQGPYYQWLESVCEDTKDPVAAMAAGIWAHALAGLGGGFPTGATPAERRVIAGAENGANGPEDESARKNLAEVWTGALATGEPWATLLDGEYKRAVENKWHKWQAELLWSLRVEVIDRYAHVDDPQVRTLATLAERLCK